MHQHDNKVEDQYENISESKSQSNFYEINFLLNCMKEKGQKHDDGTEALKFRLEN